MSDGGHYLYTVPLPQSREPASLSGELLYVFGISGSLVLADAIQGILLDCLALMARGTCISESPGTVTIKETVFGRLPSPGHCTDSRPKHIPSLSMREA